MSKRKLRRILQDLLDQHGATRVECRRCGQPDPACGGIVIIFPGDHPGDDETVPVPTCPRYRTPVGPDGRSLGLRLAIVLPTAEGARGGGEHVAPA